VCCVVLIRYRGCSQLPSESAGLGRYALPVAKSHTEGQPMGRSRVY
jgi:hypothetical protein